jgi:putative endonuclease
MRRDVVPMLVGGCCVYILLCSDGSYYVGSTRAEAETRESQHNLGHHPGSYTYFRRPVRLVWSERFEQIKDAIAFERQIKGWAREKKEALIAGRFDLLPALSRKGRTRPKRD